jgi:hypothetical protein
MPAAYDRRDWDDTDDTDDADDTDAWEDGWEDEATELDNSLACRPSASSRRARSSARGVDDETIAMEVFHL